MGIVRFFRAVFLVMRIGEDAVIHDGLTGLYRREEAIRRGSKAIKSAIKKGEPISVVIIDLDELKSINDREGHDEGDLILKRLGTFIMNGCRGKGDGRDLDIPGRYGGDEFIIIMPGSSEEGATLFIDRIRRRADAAGVKFSYGIAGIRPGTNFRDAIKAADKAMYTDKRSRKGGGDR